MCWRMGGVVQALKTIWLKDLFRKACKNKAGLAFFFFPISPSLTVKKKKESAQFEAGSS